MEAGLAVHGFNPAGSKLTHEHAIEILDIVLSAERLRCGSMGTRHDPAEVDGKGIKGLACKGPLDSRKHETVAFGAFTDDADGQMCQGQLDRLPAGGDGALVVIGVVFVVLLILELTGVVNVFNRV